MPHQALPVDPVEQLVRGFETAYRTHIVGDHAGREIGRVALSGITGDFDESETVVRKSRFVGFSFAAPQGVQPFGFWRSGGWAVNSSPFSSSDSAYLSRDSLSARSADAETHPSRQVLPEIDDEPAVRFLRYGDGGEFFYDLHRVGRLRLVGSARLLDELGLQPSAVVESRRVPARKLPGRVVLFAVVQVVGPDGARRPFPSTSRS